MENQEDMYRPHYICNCCDRTLEHKVVFHQVRFAVDPKDYSDFYVNNSICSHCIDLLNGVFNYDFSNINEGLVDGYYFFKQDGFFKLDNEKDKEDDVIFILGISPTMPEDYHVLYIDKEAEQAVINTVNAFKRYSEQPIRSFRDLLR